MLLLRNGCFTARLLSLEAMDVFLVSYFV